MSYGWATVFTLAAWFAGLVIDANVRVGDLGLRTVLPVIVMGCCVMKYIKAVSYTHLDVYKRQALTARAPTVSITSVNAAISTRFNTGWCFFFFKASVIRSSHWDVSG